MKDNSTTPKYTPQQAVEALGSFYEAAEPAQPPSTEPASTSPAPPPPPHTRLVDQVLRVLRNKFPDAPAETIDALRTFLLDAPSPPAARPTVKDVSMMVQRRTQTYKIAGTLILSQINSAQPSHGPHSEAALDSGTDWESRVDRLAVLLSRVSALQPDASEPDVKRAFDGWRRHLGELGQPGRGSPGNP